MNDSDYKHENRGNNRGSPLPPSCSPALTEFVPLTPSRSPALTIKWARLEFHNEKTTARVVFLAEREGLCPARVASAIRSSFAALRLGTARPYNGQASNRTFTGCSVVEPGSNRLSPLQNQSGPFRSALILAEREGFEPSIRLLTLYSLSRGAPSTTRPSLRLLHFRQLLLLASSF